MDIVEKIKSFLKRLKKEQPKMLPEPTRTHKKESYIDKFKVKSVVADKEPTIEESFDEFIKQYARQEEISKGNLNNTYRAFSRMFCKENEEIGNNLKNQEKLKKLVRERGCYCSYQYAKGTIAFLHIMGEDGLDEFKDAKLEKLYINCDRKNISELTANIFDRIQGIAGDKLQMKCVCEQFLDENKKEEEKNPNKNYQRNDKIVVFAENHEMADRMADEINELRYKKPELFSNTKKLPFIPKKYGFIGIGKKQLGEYAETPVGTAAGRTYNDYMSEIVCHSVVAAFDTCLKMGPETSEEPITVRMGEYSRIYPEMQPDEKQQILQKSKEIFGNICHENGIKTAYRENEETQRVADIELNK